MSLNPLLSINLPPPPPGGGIIGGGHNEQQGGSIETRPFIMQLDEPDSVPVLMGLDKVENDIADQNAQLLDLEEKLGTLAEDEDVERNSINSEIEKLKANLEFLQAVQRTASMALDTGEEQTSWVEA